MTHTPPPMSDPHEDLIAELRSRANLVYDREDGRGGVFYRSEPDALTTRAAQALTDLQARVGEETAKWRCFHCDFETNDQGEAELHFGTRPIFDPACRMTDLGQRREYITLDASYSRVCAEKNALADALTEETAKRVEAVEVALQLEQGWDLSRTEWAALVQQEIDRRQAAEARVGELEGVREFAADIRWLELAQGAAFTIIDRQLLGDLYAQANRAALLKGPTHG